MMPTAFDEDTDIVHPPDGISDVECLSVFKGTTAGGYPVFVSCWKPTAEEWDEMRRTGRVWLLVAAKRMPVVAVSGLKPTFSDEENPGDA